MSTEVNPYAPPRARVDDVSGAVSEVEAIRREHIKHEAGIRSIGALYYISGVLTLLAAFSQLIGARGASDMPLELLIGVLYLGVGAVLCVVAHGIRRLKRVARVASIVLSIIGLI